MILTVTMNPAYDMTYRVEQFERGHQHPVRAVEQRIGGKGINVTRVLNQLGRYSRATGFADHVFAAAAEQEIPVDFVHALPWVRRTVVINESESGTATALWEPGAAVSNPHAAEQLAVRVDGLLPGVDGLVIAGALPSGVDPSLPAEIARIGLAAGVPTICDLDGAALRSAAQVPGVVLTPNREAVHELTGSTPQTPEEVRKAVRRYIDAGVAAMVVTRGELGMVAVTADGCWNAALPEPVYGNPTGAGDSATAAIIASLTTATPLGWPEVLVEAIATAAASVIIPVAGEFDRGLRDYLAPSVQVEELTHEPLRDAT